jgi:hypothetical protein
MSVVLSLKDYLTSFCKIIESLKYLNLINLTNLVVFSINAFKFDKLQCHHSHDPYLLPG